jgi:hypothetical protein
MRQGTTTHARTREFRKRESTTRSWLICTYHTPFPVFSTIRGMV